MNTVCGENQCTGCMACLETCSRDAIRIIDQLKNYNAVIDSNKCIECGACHRVCQNNEPVEAIEPIAWYQGWSRSEEQRKMSSSGGFAATLIEQFVEDGGIACSCVFKDGVFGFDFANSKNDIAKFVGSKYVKSNPIGIYKKIRSLLREGHKVLFIGLPCQVAAVKSFVSGHLSDNLYLVDLICHGSPSPKHIERFLREAGCQLKDLETVSFRKKDVFRIMQNEHYIENPGVYDCYTLAFLNCINYTENCYSCKYAKLERVSDITIGDSWGSELAKDEQEKGISLALCQTKKGINLLEKSNVVLFPVDKETAIAHNHQLERPSQMPKTYDAFFKALQEKKTYKDAVKIALPRTYRNQQIKKLLIKIKAIPIGGGYRISVIPKDPN